MVVIFIDWTARHHHAYHPHLFGATKIFDRAVDTQDCSLRQSQDAIRRLTAHRLQPAVVGLHARVFILSIAMIAETHPDRRIDDLSGDAILIHVRQPRLTSVSAL